MGMSKNPRLEFQNMLKQALDTYHPGWDVRRQAAWSEHNQEEWEKNRRFKVWVDTLRRWVRGDHFPRVRKFEGFLESVDLPEHVHDSLLSLFHTARAERRVLPITPQNVKRETTTEIQVVGKPPISPTKQFVGRDEEQIQLHQRLNDDDTRIITIIGRSGMGKTALGCKVLHDLTEKQRQSEGDSAVDGIIYLHSVNDNVNLERIFFDCIRLLETDDSHTLNAVWASQMATMFKVRALLDALEGRVVIIMIDQLEDFLDSNGRLLDGELESFVQESLQPKSPIRLLLTSQVEMKLPRDLRHLNQLLPLDEGLSVQTGMALLRQLDPGGTCGLRDAPEEQLMAAVERVHGSPRALEVIVGILEHDRLAKLDTILARFNQLVDVREMINEGYRRLDKEARAVVEALAVYRRPVIADAVTFLLEPYYPNADTMESIQRLIRTRMVNADRATGLISLHPIDADYAYSQLAESGLYDQVALERRAAHYYRNQQAPSEQLKGIDDVLPYLVEFEHLVRAEDYDEAAKLADSKALSNLLLWGHVQRREQILTQLVGKITDDALIVANDFNLGQTYRRLGRFEDAVIHYERSLDRARQQGDFEHAGLSLLGIAHINRYLERYESAIEAYEQAMTVAHDADDAALISRAELGLGVVYHKLGEYEESRPHVDEALTYAKASDMPVLEGNCLEVLGEIHHFMGDHQQAIEALQQSIVIGQAIQDSRGETVRRSLISLVYADIGQFSQSVQEQEDALSIAEATEDLPAQCVCMERLAYLLYQQGDYEEAATFAQETLDIADKISVNESEAFALLHLGQLALYQGEFEAASGHFEDLREVLPEIRHRLYWQYWHSALSFYELLSGNLDRATDAIHTATSFPAPRHHHYGLLLQGLVELRRKHRDQARHNFEEAMTYAKFLLNKSDQLVYQRYSQAVALTGLLLLAEDDEQAELFAQAQAAFEDALNHCDVLGLVKDATLLLDVMRPFDRKGYLEQLWAILTKDAVGM